MKKYIDMSFEEAKEYQNKSYALGNIFVKPGGDYKKYGDINGKVIEKNDKYAIILYEDGERIDVDMFTKESFENFKKG
jgi:hypothetical protein